MSVSGLNSMCVCGAVAVCLGGLMAGFGGAPVWVVPTMGILAEIAFWAGYFAD